MQINRWTTFFSRDMCRMHPMCHFYLEIYLQAMQVKKYLSGYRIRERDVTFWTGSILHSEILYSHNYLHEYILIFLASFVNIFDSVDLNWKELWNIILPGYNQSYTPAVVQFYERLKLQFIINQFGLKNKYLYFGVQVIVPTSRS